MNYDPAQIVHEMFNFIRDHTKGAYTLQEAAVAKKGEGQNLKDNLADDCLLLLALCAYVEEKTNGEYIITRVKPRYEGEGLPKN